MQWKVQRCVAVSNISKAGIFDTGFCEILRSPLLQWAEKHKFQPDSRKPGVTDLSLKYKATLN